MGDTLRMTASVNVPAGARTSARPRPKDLSIESLRGLACLLIVAYHAIPLP